MRIRKAEKRDNDEIYAVIKTVFESAEHADGNEQDLFHALMAGSAYIPELSLVAEEKGKIIGHILFTKAQVGPESVLALAPLSVLPEHQKKGVGTALIREGHQTARQMGYSYSVVLGSSCYYPRFGYVPADCFGITAPFEVPQENFMACKLQEEAPVLHGVMQYAEAFGIA